MEYRVGQRVRFLHENSDGIITALIDKHHVEVDLGDDFPMEVHVDEIIGIDTRESYLMDKSPSEEASASTNATHAEVTAGAHAIRSGSKLFSLSLAICPSDEQQYDFLIINPTATEVLYTCYTRQKHKYTGMACGRLPAGELQSVFSLSDKQLKELKELYWQMVQFSPGKGYPHMPMVKQLPWNRGRMAASTRFIQALNRRGWVFSLTEQESESDRALKVQSEFVRIKDSDVTFKEERIIDLHIEEIADRPWEMAPSTMLDLQLEHMEKRLSEAIMDNFRSAILIHGVGEGTLRKEVHKRLKKTAYVSSFEPADPKRFGNGATKIYFS